MLPSLHVSDVEGRLHDVVAVLVREHVVDSQLAPLCLVAFTTLGLFGCTKGQVDERIEQLNDLIGVMPVLRVHFRQHADCVLVQFAAIALNSQSCALVLDEVQYGHLCLMLTMLED